jgi:hypothetical protein
MLAADNHRTGYARRLFIASFLGRGFDSRRLHQDSVAQFGICRVEETRPLATISHQTDPLPSTSPEGSIFCGVPMFSPRSTMCHIAPFASIGITIESLNPPNLDVVMDRDVGRR